MPIIVDHTSLALFDQIPDNYLQAARALRLLFSDRSVGQNINESLDCLTASSWASSPASCRRDYYDSNWNWKTFSQEDLNAGLVPSRILFNPDPVKYDRNNWTFEFKMGTWTELTQEFVQTLAPAYLNSKDVLSYQFSYLNVDETDDIADPNTGFFANNANKYDIYDLEAFFNQYPDKVFLLWTTSLSRSVGSHVSENFNNEMRQYAITHNKILFDVADIEAFDENGIPCFDNRDNIQYCSQGDKCENHPSDGINITAICQDYTTEVDGGHLGSVSAAKIRLAKAFWVLMAHVAGWDPALPASTSTPAASLTATATSFPTSAPSQTSAPTRTPTLAASPTRSPSPSPTCTATRTVLPSASPTRTLTPAASLTPTRTATPTRTRTSTPSPGSLPTPISSWSFTSSVLNNDNNSCIGCSNHNSVWDSFGHSPGSFLFNGSSANLNLGNFTSLDSKPAFSLSMWLKPSFAPTDNHFHYLFSDGASVQLFYLGSSHSWRFAVRTPTDTYRLNAPISWTAGAWHQITSVYTGSQLKFYWDGVLISSTPASGSVAADVTPTIVGASSMYNNFFGGGVDDLKIYDVALTDSQVAQLFTSN